MGCYNRGGFMTGRVRLNIKSTGHCGYENNLDLVDILCEYFIKDITSWTCAQIKLIAE